MTPEELSALADRIARISSGKARFYFLVPKRQQLPPVSEELEPDHQDSRYRRRQ